MRFLFMSAGAVLVGGLALAGLQAQDLQAQDLQAQGLKAQDLKAQQMPDLKDPKIIAAGHELFLEKQCAHCHGEDGRGGINLARRTLDARGVFTSIAEGRERNGIRMPEWRGVLSDDEIWQATAYVLSISQSSGVAN